MNHDTGSGRASGAVCDLGGVDGMNKQGRRPELHKVDGREMTVKEIADMLGISANALHCRRVRLGPVSYQTLVDMYRSNQFGIAGDKACRYLIEGRWMTRTEIARMLGVQPRSLSNYRKVNKATMIEAVEHFRRWNEEGRKRNPLGTGGRPAQVYTVGRRKYTVPGVAKQFGVHPMTVRDMLKSRDGDMGKVLAFYQAKARKKQKRAESEIMRILGY